jgi:ubiquinone/menaquinone biosynthesis C-methylase UbiE
MSTQIDFDTELARIYDETRPIDGEACRAGFRAALKSILGNQHSRIVDVGCGTGRVLKCLIPDIVRKEQVVGIDISGAMLAIAKTTLKGVDLREISLTDFANETKNHQSFDVVICHWLFHCIPDWQTALRACTRLAKKSGILIWLNEDGDLYQALDGMTGVQSNSKKSLNLLFEAYYRAVNDALQLKNAPQIVPSSRAGTVLRCTEALESELANWGWDVQSPWGTQYWVKEVSAGWIIDKILTPRVYTNLRNIPPDINSQAIKKLRVKLGSDGIPRESDLLKIEFWAKCAVACAGSSADQQPAARTDSWWKRRLKQARSSQSWYQILSLLFRFEPMFRAWAEKRKAFLPIAFSLVATGVLGIWWKIGYGPMDLRSYIGELLFDGSSLLLAALGFFYAIYAIKGLLERPRDLNEVLFRSTELVNRFLEKENHTAVMLTEYPAWGALSARHAPAYCEFSTAFTGFLKEGANRKFILVAPSFHEMQNRIDLYTQDYGRLEDEAKEAKKANNTLCADLKSGGDRSQNHFKHWEVNEVPRYQMLLIGKEYERSGQDLEFMPVEAIIWFAPRSSDVTDPVKRKKVDRDWIERDVPVLAWQITDSYILKELYECARFYVSRDCKRCTSYRDFLGLPEQTPHP